MKRKIKRDPYRVYGDGASPYVCGLGVEWRCPRCGAIFLIRGRAWGYILNGLKYCSHRCLRAAEDEKKK